MDKETDMSKRPMLTEAEIVSNPELVAKIKNAQPVGSPMSADDAIAWIKNIR